MVIYRNPKTGRFISKEEYNNVWKDYGKTEQKNKTTGAARSDNRNKAASTGVSEPETIIIKGKSRTVYRDPVTKTFISQKEWRAKYSFMGRQAQYGSGVYADPKGDGNQYVIFVKATSKDGYVTYHGIVQGSTTLDKRSKDLIIQKARERYDHHGGIKLEPLHTVNRLTGEVVSGGF